MDKKTRKSLEEIINYLHADEERHWSEAGEPETGHIFCDVKLWLQMGGNDANPFARNRYKLDGYDDDAIVLTADIIAAIKVKYPDVEYFDSEVGEEKVSSLSTEDIGDWLVLVDYHA